VAGPIVGKVTVGGEGAAVPLPVFVDVDTGVDDAMALAYLFASDDADVVGIASTAGNVPVQQVCRNNLGLLELCQITRVPVSKGSEHPVNTPLRTAEDTHGPEGLGYAQLPRMTPPRRGCAPHRPIPVSWWPSPPVR
jgi:purine nucleosidase